MAGRTLVTEFCVRRWRARERLADRDWLLDVGLLGPTLEALMRRATQLDEGSAPPASL